MSQVADQPPLNVVNSAFMWKVFYAFAALALLSAGVSLAGKLLGGSIAMAGHTDDTRQYEVVIGNNVLMAPANSIRFERQRVSGVAQRLDLYLRWPQLDGYSREASSAFNHSDGGKSIVFLSFEPQMMSRGMSGRFEPIYRSLIVDPPMQSVEGVDLYAFSEKSGYLNEELAVARRAGDDPFVARCLTGVSAQESLAPCERDMLIGDGLSLSYRFPRELLGQWQELDTAIHTKATALLRR